MTYWVAEKGGYVPALAEDWTHTHTHCCLSFSCIFFSRPLDGFLFDLLQFFKVFPSTGEPQTGHNIPEMVWIEGNNHLLQPGGYFVPAASFVLAFLRFLPASFTNLLGLLWTVALLSSISVYPNLGKTIYRLAEVTFHPVFLVINKDMKQYQSWDWPLRNWAVIVYQFDVELLLQPLEPLDPWASVLVLLEDGHNIPLFPAARNFPWWPCKHVGMAS